MTTTLNTGMDAGLALKREGQARAVSGATDWSERAMEEITALADANVEFTSEDVTRVIGLPSTSVGMNENNAVGAVFSGACRKGIIEWTGRLTKSSREERHASDLRIWRKAAPSDDPFINVQASMLRRLAAMANKGLSALTDPDPEFVVETQEMISSAREILVGSHR